ncbi:MAG: hypothetical protein RR494_06080 [Vagococcus sp.]|uniref:hypothetical protein n=1 Tax=Vagococcus TaxID=2737 RepID=UPI002FC59B52
MTIKQIKKIKIVRGILLSIYIYFGWEVIQAPRPKSIVIEHLLIINVIIILCIGILSEVLPKEHRSGNTFSSYKSKLSEMILELVFILILAGCLIYFL